MIALRVVGIIVALLAIGVAANLYSRRRIRRLDLIITWAVATGVVALGAYPDLFSPIFNALDFTEGNNRRILGVLVMAVAVLFLLNLRATSVADTAQRDVNRLIRALAQRDFDPKNYPELAGADVCVIIPAYNESATIAQVLKNLPREVGGLRVGHIVVDDGSNDATSAIAREHGAVLVHPINRGQGAALLTGYEMAHQAGAKIVAITDADGQTVPEELERLLQPIVDDEADFVNGSRVLGSYEPESSVRALGVGVLSRVVSLLTATRVTDVSSPFRAFRAEAIERLHLQQPQFQASELLIESIRKGLRYREVPITMRRRQAGESRKPGSVKYAWGFVKAMMTTWLR
ncbi:MAG: glycosyltransferase family 2 protein [Dehalococcoidia bacterium]